MANRPMNAQILTDTLFNEGIKKPAIQRALDSLLEAQRITCKGARALAPYGRPQPHAHT